MTEPENLGTLREPLANAQTPSDIRAKVKNDKVFYGWWIVFGAFCILVVAAGAGLYALPIFLVPLQEHFGWTRAGISTGPAVAAVVSAVLAPFVGVLLERFGTRKVMCFGASVMALGFLGLASIAALWHFWLASAVVAIGISLVAFIPVQTLISHWFTRRRGLAMGLTLAGIGFGGLMIAPLTGQIITAYGWREAYLTLAVLVVVLVTVIVLSLIRQSPQEMGLLPDGDIADESLGDRDAEIVLPGMEVGEAMRTGVFWFIAMANFLGIFAAFGIVQHLAALLSDAGYSASRAASVLGISIGITMVGRVLFGLLTDRFAIRWIFATVVALPAVAAFLLMSIDSTPILVLFCICFGLGLGGIAVISPLAVGACFGLRAFSKIVGAIFVSATLGASAGPVITGKLYDINGDYRVALMVLIVAGCIGVVSAIFVVRPAALARLEIV